MLYLTQFINSLIVQKEMADYSVIKVVFIVLLGVISHSGLGQGEFVPYLHNYYYDYKLSNPSFVGNDAKHKITTAYSGVLNDDNGNGSYSRAFLASYEAKLSKIKSGIGGMIVRHKFGSLDYVDASLLLSHQFKLTKTSGIQLGTQLQIRITKIDGKYYKYVDKEDPLVVEGEESQKNFNFGLGMNYYSRHFTIGFGYKRIKANDFGYDSVRQDTDVINLNLFREIKVCDWLNVTPSIFYFTDLSSYVMDVNNTFEIKKWILAGAGYRIPQEGEGDFTFNIGVNIKDYVQVVAHIYSYDRYKHQSEYDEKPTFVEAMILVKIPERNRE